MTPILKEQTRDPIAWRGSDVLSKEFFAFDLSARNQAALKDILLRLKDVPNEQITKEFASHPALDDDLMKVYRDVMHGKGLVLLRGVPSAGHSVEEIEKIFWAILIHWGPLLSNNSFGHKMVWVQQEVLPGGVQPARGTKSAGELAMHNDSSDMLTLLCVHQADEGGESQYSSGPAAHNTILAERPDLLPILYRGFPHHRRSEQYDDQPAVTPYDVPVFSNNKGKICINFTYSSIIPAVHEIGRTLTDQEIEALDLLRSVLLEQQVEFRMAPGEAVVANNYAMCHSRSNFVDGPTPERRRLMLRAWNEVVPEDRRLPVGREFFLMENKGGRLGYDAIPGREGKIARNDYVGVDENLANLFKATQQKPKPRART